MFGDDAHVALAQEAATHGTRAWTDVALGGSSLSSDAVAVLSREQRDMLKAAQSAQLLSAVSACIETRFPGGITLLQAAATRSRPQIAPALDALSLKLLATSAACAPAPTYSSLTARVHYGEALEKKGDFLDAAAVYKSCVEDMTRNSRGCLSPPPFRMYQISVPLLWSFYGLALKRGGRLSEASNAYEAGLRALPAMPLQAGRVYEVERESLRLDLLVKLIMLHRSCGNAAACVSAQRRIFHTQLAELEASGDEGHVELHMSGGATLTGIHTRRRWELVLQGDDAPASENQQADDDSTRFFTRIVQLPPAPE